MNQPIAHGPDAHGPVAHDPEAHGPDVRDPGAHGTTAHGPGAQEPAAGGSGPDGQYQRQALIEAALRIIERDGAAGITHRTVAHEAQLPTTAATSAFESPDALLTAALTSAMELGRARPMRATSRGASGPPPASRSAREAPS
ncbi:hypothetical protein AB0B79_19805, partial [Streptomyces sp. NPDC039022]